MSQLLTDLIEAGTPAHLVAEVAMLLAKAEVADQRRKSDRARQQAKRDRDNKDSHVTSRDVTSCHNGQKIAPPPPPPSFPPTPPITPPTPAPPDNNTRARKGRSANALANELRPPGIDDQIWADFLAVRAKKRMPLTKTAMKQIEREAAKLGWTLAQGVTESAGRSWGGFRASWIITETNGNGAKSIGSKPKDGAMLAIDRRLAELAGTARRSADDDGYGTGPRPITAIADMR